MNDRNSSGMGLLGVLTIIFVTLKLTGLIQWSWWWVLSPIWGPIAVALIVIALWTAFWFWERVFR